MDFKTFTNEEIESILKLLNDANDAQRINVYSRNKLEKAIKLLKK